MAAVGHKSAFFERGIVLHHDTPELASAYDRTSLYQFENGKQLISVLNISGGERVLDIGMGTGNFAAYVAKIVGHSGWVVGIDPLPLRIEIAQSKASGNFEARVGRAEDLSQFADATFDVVYLNSVFHWVEDKPRALAEILRVLKAGGRLGFNCHDTARPSELRPLAQRALVEAGVELDRHKPRGLASDELEAMVVAAGFTAYSSELRTFVDFFSDVDALITWASSSSFGTFFVGVTAVNRAAVRGALGRLLEPKHTPEGIQLERYLTFATARKPSAD
jgi:ubiquinone/menaquinone biosynthesis C-methylase UbiE